MTVDSKVGEYDDLRDVADRLDQMITRTSQTEQRLEKIEKMRRSESDRKSSDRRKRPTLASVQGLGERPSRPRTTRFKAPDQTYVRSRDITLDQVFESLQHLRDQVNELSENHTEMVNQMNVIKRLIH